MTWPIRITVGEDGKERLFRKFTFNAKEAEMEWGNETATQVQLGGEFITKEEYEQYGGLLADPRNTLL